MRLPRTRRPHEYSPTPAPVAEAARARRRGTAPAPTARRRPAAGSCEGRDGADAFQRPPAARRRSRTCVVRSRSTAPTDRLPVSRDAERELLASGARELGIDLDAAAARDAAPAGGRTGTRQRAIQSDGNSRPLGHAAQTCARQLEPAALPARRAHRRCRHRRRISGPAAGHRQSAAALHPDRGDRQESALRRANRRALRRGECSGRECARRKLSAVRTFRYSGGAGAVLAGGFRRLCRSFVRSRTDACWR